MTSSPQDDSGLFFGRTYREFLPPEATPSGPSLEAFSDQMPPSITHGSGENGPVRVWLSDPRGPQLGAFSTLNIQAWPNDVNVCSLWQALDPPESIPSRSYLNGAACRKLILGATMARKPMPPIFWKVVGRQSLTP
jgi:hypothetical protein